VPGVGAWGWQLTGVTAAHVGEFARQCRQLQSVHSPTIAYLVAAAVLVWWPLDLIVFRGQPDVIASYTGWRWITAVLLVGSVTLARITGWFMGRLGGMDGPWYFFLIATPMFTIPS
jgi:hypothetical protein